MAGDWIKMRTDVYRDPKVTVIADQLLEASAPLAGYVSQNLQCGMSVTRNVMRNAVVGALVSVWGVARREGRRDGDDLRIDNAALGVIDDIADMIGFGEAMCASGWLVKAHSALVFPRFFEEYNVDPTTDAKAKNRERQRRFRAKKSNVTETLDNAPRREEKREEKSKEKKPPSPFANLPVELDTTDFREALADWVRHRKEIRKPLTPTSVKQQLRQFADWGPARSLAAIRYTLTKGWQGLREPEPDAVGGAPPKPPRPRMSEGTRDA